jgi:hypothetical protein
MAPSTVHRLRFGAPPSFAGGRRGLFPERDRTVALALVAVLLVAFGLRVWGIGNGMPFSYNSDEEGHFVPIAIGFFGHSLDPRYFLNPPGYSELLYAIYAVWFGGREAVSKSFANDPTQVFVIARVTTALLGTLAVWLLYALGSRLFDRRVGLLSAALGACAFLPVFYGHLALNDVPTLAPATLSLLGAALVLRRGWTLDVLLGGFAAGLAAGTKYTAAIVLLPLLTAIALHARAGGARPAVRVARMGVLALVAALAGLFLASPYTFLDFSAFHAGVSQQQELAGGDELAKLGLTQHSGIVYYLWSLTWGLGWIPALAALGGAVRLALRDRALALLLLPAPILYVLYMGMQDRYFGRWILPVLPIVIVLAASFGLAVVRTVARRAPALGPLAGVVVAAALLAQGVVTSLHVDVVLARPDTRNAVRAWMLVQIPAGAGVVVEPVVPDAWYADPDHAHPALPDGNRWRLWDTTRADVDDAGRPLPGGRTRFVRVDKYERTLRPALIGDYVRGGYCWVVTASMQRDRAFAQPEQAPLAIAYYRALEQQGQAVLRATPYRAGATPPAFNFDWSFDYYPFAYERPGPQMTVYRLHGGRCG